ncbi:MAG: hypothetical protein IH862_11400 [Chloroflexi bacterium]|nr:hypothetical protein [Chloroflexota bacterium]
MSRTDVPDAHGDEGDPQVQSGEAAPADGQPSSTVHANGRSGTADGGIGSASPTDAVAKIVLQAEQLAQGVREVAAKEAELQAAEILSEAEAKAREEILEPAATRAAANSQEIMAKAEQEAEAILAGIRRLFSRVSSDGSTGGDSFVTPTESAPASDSVRAGDRPSVPSTMSPMQRDQLKEVIARRMGAPLQN